MWARGRGRLTRTDLHPGCQRGQWNVDTDYDVVANQLGSRSAPLLEKRVATQKERSGGRAGEWKVSMGVWVVRRASIQTSVRTSRFLQTTIHWGQGVVYRASTLQAHCKEMDNVPSIYLLGTSQVHSEFPSQFPYSFPSPGNDQYIHSVPGHVTAMFPLGN